ncbi:MAG: AAA family ATPase [Clostridiales Family XIII bacterium]|jgi:ATP-dependent Clp protease ATP-binding subunit ClpA|nr:AAA family ATPase [Clostridiales Family XIII bacterium]
MAKKLFRITAEIGVEGSSNKKHIRKASIRAAEYFNDAHINMQVVVYTTTSRSISLLVFCDSAGFNQSEVVDEIKRFLFRITEHSTNRRIKRIPFNDLPFYINQAEMNGFIPSKTVDMATTIKENSSYKESVSKPESSSKNVEYNTRYKSMSFEEIACEGLEPPKPYEGFWNSIDSPLEDYEYEGEENHAEDELYALIGLGEVKEVIRKILAYANVMQKCRGRIEMKPLHMVFTGNPGTAKTTVARILAKILAENGITKKGTICEVGRSDIVGEYTGWTAKNTKKAFTNAIGSVLFLDEAYSLVEDHNSYGNEAINTIVQEMENHRHDVVVILAGYPKEMNALLEKNPGLRSRISFHVDFPDYTDEELYQIMEYLASQNGFILGNGVRECVIPMIHAAMEEKGFGGGRWIRRCLDLSEMNWAVRVENMPKRFFANEKYILMPEDIGMPSDTKDSVRSIGFIV